MPSGPPRPGGFVASMSQGSAVNAVATPMPDRNAAADSPPVRLVCRHVSRLLLARNRRWLALMPDDRLAGLVFETALSAGVAHLPYHTAGPAPEWLGLVSGAALARPVTVLAITQSLDLSYASGSRRVTTLVGAGLLLKETRGVRVAPGVLADGRVAKIAAGDRADLAETIALLAAAGHDCAPALARGGLERIPDDVVERLLLTFALRALESLKALYGGVLDGILAATITAANVAHLIENPALGSQFAGEDAPPPDVLRQPIPVREIARRVGLPFETVRRRVNALRDAGLVEAHEAGMVLPTRVLMREVNLADNVRLTRQFHRLLEALTELAGG